jgi:hypothetical protein
MDINFFKLCLLQKYTSLSPRYDLLIHHKTSQQIFAGNYLKTFNNIKQVSVKRGGGISIFVTLIFTMCICFKFRNNTLSYIKT